MSPNNQRLRLLETVVSRLQLQYGPLAIARAATFPLPSSLPHISTTFQELDAALAQPRTSQIGGLPRGRISEITGPVTSGKLTLAAKVLASAQRERAALVGWIDLGRTCDPDYLHRCGLDLDRLLIVRPESSADALAITLHLLESNTLAALVFDNLADLEPGIESMLAGVMERISTVVAGTETAVLFLSEPHAQFRTLAHVATVRLSLTRERWLTEGHDVRGYEGRVEVLKNKLGRSGISAPIRITFDGTVQGDGL